MWEYPAFVFVLFVTYLLARNKVKNTLAKQPEMQYFMPGLFAKIIGGFMFACIYVFYYQQGDTTSFYECSLAFCKLFQTDFNAFLTVLLGDGTQEMKSYFTSETGEPMMYMFGESSTRFVIKILIPFLLLAGHSYFIATAFISIFTFGALWSLYRVFLFYFPQQYRILAWAILFMPSVVFWGSGILKDSFTLAATCYFIVFTHRIANRIGGIFDLHRSTWRRRRRRACAAAGDGARAAAPSAHPAPPWRRRSPRRARRRRRSGRLSPWPAGHG
jgi:hypothetical protein